MEQFRTNEMAFRLYRAFLDLMALACLDPKAAAMTAEWIQDRCANGAESEAERAFVSATITHLIRAEEN